MPLYRNHFRRSRDAPSVVGTINFNCSIAASEVNRCYIDVPGAEADSASGLPEAAFSSLLRNIDQNARCGGKFLIITEGLDDAVARHNL